MKSQSWIRNVAVLVVLTLGTRLPLASGQQQHTPLAGKEKSATHKDAYPRGTNWLQRAAPADAGKQVYPGAQAYLKRYEKIKKKIMLGLPPAMMKNTSAVGIAASNFVQTTLPKGFEIGEATAVRTAPSKAAAPGAGTWFVSQNLKYKKIPVARFCNVLTVIGGIGQVYYVRKTNIPTAVDASIPTVAPEKAVQVARADAEKAFGKKQLEASKPQLEIWVDNSQKGHLAWTFTVRSPSLAAPQAHRYWISATKKAKLLFVESIIYHQHKGTVTAEIWGAASTGSTTNRPLEALEVSRAGGGGGTKITNKNGKFLFPGIGSATISASLQGPFCVIENLQGPVLSQNEAGDHTSPIDLDFNATGEFQLAQTSAFYWTNVGYHFAKNILDPIPGQPFKELPTRVNIDASCNAFWDGSSINFFKAGNGCPNTAFVDVVLHEYFHGVDDWSGGILDGGLSEGCGDVATLLVTRQPCVGRDFFGPGTCLRDATDVDMWPPSPGEGVHSIGKRYAQFNWQVVEELKKSNTDDESFDIASRLFLAATAANPLDIPDAVMLHFIADDDDGDLSNGTPHFKELAAAADSRNLPRPPDPQDGGPTPTSDCCPVVASAQFPFGTVKADKNQNIAKVTFKLAKPSEVHISANTSAALDKGSTLFTNGFSNNPNVNIMWTDSLRFVTVSKNGHWINFGSTMSVTLPKGTHTIYWRVWVNKATLSFDSGAMLVQAFPTKAGSLAAAKQSKALAPTPHFEQLGKDANGQNVTKVNPGNARQQAAAQAIGEQR